MVCPPGAGILFGSAEATLDLDAVGGDMVAGRGHLLHPRQFRLQFAKLRRYSPWTLGDRLERVHRFFARLAILEAAKCEVEKAADEANRSLVRVPNIAAVVQRQNRRELAIGVSPRSDNIPPSANRDSPNSRAYSTDRSPRSTNWPPPAIRTRTFGGR